MMQAAKTPNLGTMDMDGVKALVKDDMQIVDRLIQNRLQSNVVLINQLGHYIVTNGGKRMRPILLILSAHACGYQGDQHCNLAAVVEFIHTATLLHDDVVDNSSLRRGKETANHLWGNEASVLTGDFLYSRAFQMMVESGSMRVMEVLADATNVIAEGEVMQLLNCHEPGTSEAQYMEVIQCKTAKLFEAATRLGAILSNRPPQEEEALACYGKHLGTAFQLIDDALDYSADSGAIGKNIGDDLAEGKPTLPLIYALQHAKPEQQTIIYQAILQGSKENLATIQNAIESSGAIAYTIASAQREADKAINALDQLPPSLYAQALACLASFTVQRSY